MRNVRWKSCNSFLLKTIRCALMYFVAVTASRSPLSQLTFAEVQVQVLVQVQVQLINYRKTIGIQAREYRATFQKVMHYSLDTGLKRENRNLKTPVWKCRLLNRAISGTLLHPSTANEVASRGCAQRPHWKASSQPVPLIPGATAGEPHS